MNVKSEVQQRQKASTERYFVHCNLSCLSKEEQLRWWFRVQRKYRKTSLFCGPVVICFLRLILVINSFYFTGGCRGFQVISFRSSALGICVLCSGRLPAYVWVRAALVWEGKTRDVFYNAEDARWESAGESKRSLRYRYHPRLFLDRVSISTL